jgi:integrase/recombinase XerD
MLTLYRRHSPNCPHAARKEPRRYRKCHCPIWVQGSLGGEYVKKALDLTSWAAASDLVTGWAAAGEIGVVKPEAPSVREAVKKFLADAKVRHLGWESIRKYENVLERRLVPWCEGKGFTRLKQLGVEQLGDFRNSWKDGPVYAGKNLERLRSFFRFCRDRGWIKENPALALKPPKASGTPTLPFTDEEFQQILNACDRYRGDKDRIKAFILTMRHSGLRIGDVCTLRRDRVADGKIFLRQAKTGQPVWVPVPPVVVDALEKLRGDGEWYFWTGRGKVRTITSDWQRYLASVFELSGVPDCHSHRFRDTAAVTWLLKGVTVEDVSALLGHSSIRVTEKHYLPFVKKRQDRLEDAVRSTWA